MDNPEEYNQSPEQGEPIESDVTDEVEQPNPEKRIDNFVSRTTEFLNRPVFEKTKEFLNKPVFVKTPDLIRASRIQETDLYQMAYAAEQARYPMPAETPHWLQKKYEEAWRQSADDMFKAALMGKTGLGHEEGGVAQNSDIVMEHLEEARADAQNRKRKGIEGDILDMKYGEFTNSPVYMEVKKRVLELALNDYKAREAIDNSYRDYEKVVLNAEINLEEEANRKRYEQYIQDRLDATAKQNGLKKAWVSTIRWANGTVFGINKTRTALPFRVAQFLDNKLGDRAKAISGVLEQLGASVFDDSAVDPDMLDPEKLLTASLQKSKSVAEPIALAMEQERRQLQAELDNLPLLVAGIVVRNDRQQVKDHDQYLLYADTYDGTMAKNEWREHDEVLKRPYSKALFEKVSRQTILDFIDSNSPNHQTAYNEVATKLYPLIRATAWGLDKLGFVIGDTAEEANRIAKVMVAIRESLTKQEDAIMKRIAEREKAEREETQRLDNSAAA